MPKSSLRVAIVDDDESVLKAVRRLLTAAGLNAETFGSGEAFLQSLEKGQPDCVVLDVHMPGMSGLEVQAELTADHCTIPIIFITAHDDQQALAQALAAGASGFLRKPFSADALISAIVAASKSGDR